MKSISTLFTSLALFIFTVFVGEISAQSVRMPQRGVQTATAQGTVIYDNGGSGAYLPNSRSAITILPVWQGGKVSLNFTSWDVDCKGDYLYIFDGTDPQAPLIGIYSCSAPSQIITANSWNLTGALTLLFLSDDAVEGAGFALNATTACGAGVANVSEPFAAEGKTVTLNLVGENTGTIRWESTTDYGKTWKMFPGVGPIVESHPITENTQFRAVVECPSGNGYSTIVAVQVIKLNIKKEDAALSKDDSPTPMATCAQDFAGAPLCARPPFSINTIAQPSVICQGQSSQLQATATSVAFFDNFGANNINCALWNCGVTNGTIGQQCGVAPPPSSQGNTIYFTNVDQNGLRRLTTNTINTQTGGSISFWIRFGAENQCESPDICGQEEVFLEYSTNGGATWTVMFTFEIGPPNGRNCQAQAACNNNNGNPVPLNDCNPWRGNWVFMDIPIPQAARTANTIFRWRQNQNSGNAFDNWALDDVRINIGSFDYFWDPPQTLNNRLISNPVATPTQTTTYSVAAISNIGGCCIDGTVTVTVNPTNPGTVAANQTICHNQTPANLTLTGNTGPVVRWEATNGLCPQQNWTNIGTTATSYNPGILQNNGQTPLLFTYRAVTQPQGCGELFSNCVTVTVNPLPNPPTLTPAGLNLCAGQVGATFTVQNPNNGQYLWYTQNVGGTSIFNGTTFTVPPPNQAITYFVENIVNGCTSARRAATVGITPILAPTANNRTFCRGENGAQICVANPVNGETYRWMDQPVGGTQLGIGTCYNAGGTIANTNGTFNYYVERIAGACTSSRTMVTVNVNTGPGPTVPNETACVGETGVNMCVQNPVNGTTYAWYTVNVGGTPVNTGTCYNNIPTGNAGTFTFFVESIANGCTSLRSQTRLTVSDLAPPTFLNPVQVCPNQPGELFASGPQGAGILFYWYDQQNGGTLLSPAGGLARNQDWITPPINTNPRCFWLEYTDPTQPGCVSPRVQACINWDPNSPPAPTPLFTDSVICANTPIQIRVTAPNNGFNFTWRRNGNVIGAPNRPFPAAETFFNLPVGTYVYEVTATSVGNCVGPPATVTITVADDAVPGTLSGPATVCSGQPVDLTLSGHTGFVQNWERNVNNGGWTNIVNTLLTYNDPSVTQPTCYRAIVGPCNPQPTPDFCVTIGGGNLNPGTAQVQIVAGNPGQWAATRTACGNFNPTVRLTGHTGQVVRWESATDGGPYNNTVTTLNVTTITPVLGGTQRCFRAIVESPGCGQSPSQPACINIDQVTGTLVGNNTICQGGCTGNLELQNVAGDIAGWQSTTNIQGGNCTWSGIGFTATVLNQQGLPEIGNTLARCNLTATTCYRARIQSALFPDPNACATLLTNEIRVVVNTPSVGGMVSANHTICEGSNSNQLNLTGNNGAVQRWEFDTNGDQNWVPINNLTNNYIATGLTAGVYCFRAIVRNAPCDEIPSASSCVTVDPPTIAGTVSAAQTICQNTQPQPISLTGHRGSITGWEVSPNGGNFTLIPGTAGLTTLTSVLMGNLTQGTCYRAVVRSGVCPSANSNIVCMTIDLPSQGGTLAQDQTICQGSTPSALTLSGHRGTILNWESASNRLFTQNLATISNTADNYDPGVVNTLICFRAVVKNGECPPANSNVVCVTTDLPSLGGNVRRDSTVCESSSISRIFVRSYRGNVLRWERDDTGNDFISGVTNVPNSANDTIRNLNFPVPGLVCFRAVVKNASCPEVFSAPACVTVEANPVPGTLSSNQTICSGQCPTDLTLTGFDGTLRYWTYSFDNFVTQDTVRITNATLRFGPGLDLACPTRNLGVRAIVDRGTCPNFTSNTVNIIVDPAVVVGTLASNRTICSGTTTTLTLTGNNGTIDRWEISSDNTFPVGGLTTVTNTSSNTFTTGPITGRRFVRVGIISGSCPIEYAGPITIDIHPEPVAGNLTAPNTICANGQNPNVTLNLANHSGTIVNWEFAPDCNAQTWTPENPVNTTPTLNVPALAVPGRCYRVAVTNTSGNCTTVYSNAVRIQADALPTVGTLSANPLTVCSGRTATLTLNGTVGTVTRWEEAPANNFIGSTDFSTNDVRTIVTPAQTARRCYRAWVSNGACPAQPTNDVCVDVFPTVSPGAVTPSQTVCVQGGTVSQLTLTGHQGPIVRWESAPDNTFSPITTIDNLTATFTPNDNPPVARCYRAVIQAGGQCPEVSSQAACITVDARPVPGTLTGETTVCVNNPQATLTLTGFTTDIVWWTGADDRAFTQNITTINNITGTLTVTPPQTRCYRAWVSNGVCPAEPSNIVCVAVDLLSLPGALTLTGPATICQGATAGPINLTGQRTDVLRWETRLGNGNYTPIPNITTTLTTAPLNVPGNHCFRAVVQNGLCPSVNTDDICIQVDATTQTPTITADNTVCALANNGTLTATLGNGAVVRWERSPDGVNGWQPAPGANQGLTYTYTNLTQTTFFRVIVRNGLCLDANSSTVRIQVDPASTPGAITGTAAVCEGNNTGRLDLGPGTGGVVNWLTQVNCTGNFVPSNPANQTTFLTFTNLTQTTCYRVIVKSGICPEETTLVHTVLVNPSTIPGTITPAHTICLNEPTQVMTLAGNRGDVLRWERSADCNPNNTWTLVTQANQLTLQLPNLTTTTCFRTVVQSAGCDAVPTPGVLVTVIQLPSPGQVSDNQTICFNTAPRELRLTGQQGDVTTWQVSTDNINFTNIPSTQGLTTFTPSALTQTSYFRTRVRPAGGGNVQCPDLPSGSATIIVDPATVRGTLTNNSTFCITDPATGTLNLNGHVGAILRWETSLNAFGGGVITSLSNINVPTLRYENLTVTTSYRVVVKSGVCDEQTSNAVTVQVDQTPTAPTAGPDQRICSDGGRATMAANTITTGTGTWTRESGPNNPTFTANNPLTTVTGMIAGTYVFRWTSRNGQCADQFDEVVINVDQDVSQPDAGPAQITICQDDARTTLDGSAPVPASSTVLWTYLNDGPVGAVPLITSPTTPRTDITGLNRAGRFTFRYTVRNGTICSPKQDDIVIIVDPSSVAGALGTSETVCQNSSRTLTVSNQTGNVVRWEQNVNNAGWTTIAGATGLTFNVTNIQATTSYRVFVRSGSCPETPTNVITLTVDPSTVRGQVSSDATVCRDLNGGVLTLSGHVGRILRWESAPTGGNFTEIPGINTTNQYTYPTLTATTRFRAVVKSGVCDEFPSGEATITVVKPEVTGTKTDILCFGQANGSINITPSGGFLPAGQNYTYRWTRDGSDISTNRNLTGLGAGRYCVTVSDGIRPTACTAEICFTIVEPPLLTSTFDGLSPVSCFNARDGRINITTRGGTPNYSFAWTRNGQPFGSPTDEDLTGLDIGTYAVVIRDANNCQTNLGPFTITQPGAIISTTSYVKPVSCSGGRNGAIGHFVTGGNPPYTFLWSPGGMTTEDSDNLIAGVYTITVTDAIGCRLVKSFTVTEPNPLTISNVQIANANCNGGTDGSIRVDVTGGTAPFFYLWSNGSSDEDIYNVGAGEYSLFVRDANGCTVRGVYTLGSPRALTGEIREIRPVTCFGGTTGGLRVNASGGVAPYTYLWNTGSTTDSTVNIGSGGYSVSVRDAKGCLLNLTYNLSSPEGLTIVRRNIEPVSCKGGNNGRIQLTVSGGDSRYTYMWNDNFQGQDRENMRAGVYTLTVTDGRGCRKIESFTVEEPLAVLSLAVNASIPPTCGRLNNGRIDIGVIGGVAPYKYMWSNGSTEEDLNNIPAGVYVLEVTDAWGCKVSTNVTLTRAEDLITEVNFVKNPTCFGQSNGSIGLQVRGGVPPYRYLWSSGQTTEDLENIPAGDYTLSVTDAQGCEQLFSQRLISPTELQATTVRVNGSSCFDAADGSAEIRVTGGTGVYRFNWSNGSESMNLQNVVGGTYRVTVRDANDCVREHLVIIPRPQPLTLTNLVKRNVSCFGGSDGSSVVRANGGTGSYRFEWRRGAEIISTGMGASNLSAGVYNLTVIDSKGCTATYDETITAPTALSVKLTSVDVTCSGNNDGSLQAEVSGGVSPYSYLWSTGRTTNLLSESGAGIYSLTVTDANGCRITTSGEIKGAAGIRLVLQNKSNVRCKSANDGSITVVSEGGTGTLNVVWNTGQTGTSVNNLQPGVYSVTATDSKGCRASLSGLVITEPSSELVTKINFITPSNCAGTPSGAIGLDVMGGTLPYSYAWSNGSSSEDLVKLIPGLYEVTITDGSGCVRNERAEVTGPKELLRFDNPIIKPVTCNGGNDGAISLDIKGGTQPYRYVWNHGSSEEDQANLRAGVYRLEVRDANNCMIMRSFEVTQAPGMTAEASEIIASGCTGSGIVRVNISGGVEPYLYKWSNGSEDRDLTGVKSGSYQLNITDALGCVKIFSVEVPSLPSMSGTIVIVKGETCFGRMDGVLDLRLSGGTAPYTYLWSNNNTTEDITNAGGGLNGVVVTDATGCVIQLSINVPSVNRLEVSSSVVSGIRCFGMKNGLIGINVTGGERPYRYAWSDGATIEDRTDLGVGVYSLTVTDVRGCISTGRYEITEPGQLVLTGTGISGERCAGSADGSVGVSVSGGVAPYTYVWSSGGAVPVMTGRRAGLHSVTVTDANGCRSTATYEIVSPKPLIIKTLSVRGANCNGGTNGGADIEIMGGTQPYRFLWTNGRTTEDLEGVPAGRYTLVLTDANDCSSEHSVTVPTMSMNDARIMGLPSAVCSGGNAITLTGVPSGGRFNGTGVVGNRFEPANLPAGTYEVTYSGVLNGCTYEAKQSIRLNARPTITNIRIGGQTDFCSSDNRSYALSVSPTEAGTNYQYSGRGVMNRMFNPSQAGQGVHVIIVTARNSLGCETRFSQEVRVTAPMMLTAVSGSGTICSGGMTTLAATGAERYEWSPAFGLNRTTGSEVEARPTRTTIYTVTGITGGCGMTTTVRVAVGSSVSVRVNMNPSGAVCAGSPVTLRASGAVSYVWSPATGLNTNTGIMVTANVNQTTVYTVTGTNADGCTGSTTVTVSIQPGGLNVSADNEVLCSGGSTTLRVTGGSGNYVWTPGNMTGGSISVSPTSTTVYTARDLNGGNCTQGSLRIVVNPSVTGGITGISERYCIQSTGVRPNLLPEGGTFSGPGVVGGTFNPSMAGVGVHELVYEGMSGSCSYRYVHRVTVGLEGSGTLLNVKDSYCVIGMPEVISALPEGGVLKVGGQLTNVIDPRALGIGTHEVRYEGVESNGCRYSVLKTIRVSTSEVEWVNVPTDLCSSSAPVLLSALPSGGTFRVNGVITPIFDARQLGAGTYEVTYSGTDGPCTYSRTRMVRITPGLSGSLTLIDPTGVNVSDGRIVVNVSGGTGVYLYSLNGGSYAGSNVFSNLSAGVYTIGVRDQSGCETTLTGELKVSSGNGCGTVMNVQVTPGNQTAGVSWSALGGATGYVVSWRRVGMNESWRSLNTANNRVTLMSLLPNVQYEVRVRARCGNVLGVLGESLIFTTLPARESSLSATDVAVEVYPNPTKDRMSINAPSGSKIEMYDLTGKLLKSFTTDELTYELNLEAMSTGVYLLKVKSEGRESILKVVKE